MSENTDPIADYDLDEVRAAIDIVATAIDDKTDPVVAVHNALILITGHLPAADIEAVLLDHLTDLARHLQIQKSLPTIDETPEAAYRRLLKEAENPEIREERGMRLLAIAAEYRAGYARSLNTETEK